MFDLASIVTYVAVVIGLFLIPGPAVLLVITRTVQGGRKVGIATGLGVASGDLIHTLSAAIYTSLISISIRPLSQLIKGLSRLRRWEGKIIGTLFVGLGVKVAFQQQ
jgi:threonine/homoserine/homoserine lactone efflux protein